MKKIRAGVVGATGYTGSEVVRLLSQHPHADIALITSETRAGERFSEVHPAFYGRVDTILQKAAVVDQTDLDVVFLALPHGVSMEYAERFSQRDFRMIDFSGDFRLGSADVYEQWYKRRHTWHEGFSKAVYGLPELYAERIRQATLVANPGCFPTGAILALAPLVQAGVVKKDGVIIDSKTGVTGAGIKASAVNMFSNVHDNFKAYGVKTHRHTIEIQRVLEDKAGELGPIQFTPHLLPVDRGILTTAYLRPDSSGREMLAVFDKADQGGKGGLHRFSVARTREQAALMHLYQSYYADAPFVYLQTHPPELKQVRATNNVVIYVDYDERTGNIIVISAIDNLVKGASGLAVQNMNVMFGLDETVGLEQIALAP